MSTEHDREIVESFLAICDHYASVPPRGTVRIIVDGEVLHEGPEPILSWAKRSRFDDERTEAMRRLGHMTDLEMYMRGINIVSSR